VGAAEKVMVVLAGCGAGLFAVNDTAVSGPELGEAGGGGGGAVVVAAVTGKSMLLVTSAVSPAIPALFTHTPTRYPEFAAVGVQLNVLVVLQSATGDHDWPLWMSHLN
jgi:hypothetical protein